MSWMLWQVRTFPRLGQIRDRTTKPADAVTGPAASSRPKKETTLMRGSQFQLALEVGVIEIDRSGGGVNSLGSKSKLDRRTYLKHIYWQDVGQPQRLQLIRLCATMAVDHGVSSFRRSFTTITVSNGICFIYPEKLCFSAAKFSRYSFEWFWCKGTCKTY